LCFIPRLFHIGLLLFRMLYHTVISDGASCLKVRSTRKTDLLEAFHERRIRESLAGSPGPSLPAEKNEFGIGGDAISRSLEWLNCTLLSRSSTTFSVPEPLILTIFMQIWTNHRTQIFEKWGVTYPQTLCGSASDSNDVICFSGCWYRCGVGGVISRRRHSV